MKIKDVLVAMDFSPNSRRALDFAIELVEQDGVILVLHVVDSDFIARLDEEGLSDREDATSRLRKRAEERLQEVVQSITTTGLQVDPMVVIGKPFAEILRVAADLDFEMIVLGAQGRRQGDIEEMLFGSTAEKVLRAARIPVISVPPTWWPES
jgi:nucleotide-binding universal stress UspA family protein